LPISFSLKAATPLTLAKALTRGLWQRPRHLAYLESILLAMVGGKCPRVLVSMPPRHGKSTTCSQWFPTWFLGHYPDQRIILASYEANFAASWGRKVRDSLDLAKAAGLFPHGVRRDVSSVSEWEIEGHSGGMITAGVGGAITGRGGNLLIDDPVKNAEEAASYSYREKAWDWYRSTAYTRLEPGCWVLAIQTRWHEDDLAGRMLQQAEEHWTVVDFPALAEEEDCLGREPGEALWPERWPVGVLEETRAKLGSYWWQALYQQQPVAREGGYFKREWFPIVEAGPAGAGVRRTRFWDCAATEAGGDYTAGAKLALTEDGLVFIEDMRRDRLSPAGVEALIKQTAELDGQAVRIREEQEPGSAGKAVVAARARLLPGHDYRGIPSTGAKTLRASGLAAQAEAGNVRLVKGAWNQDFLEELTSFPHGAHDDQVDAASGAYEDLVGSGSPTFLDPAWRTHYGMSPTEANDG